jgi:hypothetical protein
MLACPRVVLVTAVLGLTSVMATSSLAQSSCPIFKKLELPNQKDSGNRFASFSGGFVMFAKKLATDTDGAPTAYHPENIGSSHLCDGMKVYRDNTCPVDYNACYDAVSRARAVKWDPTASPAFCVFGFEAHGPEKSQDDDVIWGAGHSRERLPVQQATDPAPGFFISTTSSPLGPPTGRPDVYANADLLPYLVMPGRLTGAAGPTGYRNAGAIVRLRDRNAIFAIVADSNSNPAEISVAAAQLIHDPKLKEPRPVTEAELRGQKHPPPYPYTWSTDHHRVAVSDSTEGPYLVIALGARYGRAPDYNPDLTKLRRLGENAFSSFGGIQNMTACALRFFGP